MPSFFTVMLNVRKSTLVYLFITVLSYFIVAGILLFSDAITVYLDVPRTRFTDAEVNEIYSNIFKQQTGTIWIHITCEYGAASQGGIGTLMNSVPKYVSEHSKGQDVVMFVPGRATTLKQFPNAKILQTLTFQDKSVDILYIKDGKVKVFIFKFPVDYDKSYFLPDNYSINEGIILWNKFMIDFLQLGLEKKVFHNRKVAVFDHHIAPFVAAFGPKLFPPTVIVIHMVHDYCYRYLKFDRSLALKYFPDSKAIIYDKYTGDRIELFVAKNSRLVIFASKYVADLVGQKKMEIDFPNDKLADTYEKLYSDNNLVGISNPVMFKSNANLFTNGKLVQNQMNFMPNESFVDIRTKNREYLINTKKFNLKIEDINKPWAFFVGRYDRLKGINMLPKASKIYAENNSVFILMTSQELTDAEKAKYHERTVFLDGMDIQKNYGIFFRAACDIAVLPSKYEMLGLAHIESLNSGHLLVTTTVGGLGEFIISGNGIHHKSWAYAAKSKTCQQKLNVMKSCIQSLINGLTISYECTDYVGGCYDLNSFTIDEDAGSYLSDAIANSISFISLFRKYKKKAEFEAFIRNTMGNVLKYYIENQNGYVNELSTLVTIKLL